LRAVAAEALILFSRPRLPSASGLVVNRTSARVVNIRFSAASNALETIQILYTSITDKFSASVELQEKYEIAPVTIVNAAKEM
jgi:hypothetical protein